ncbi:MAG: hypothetical protein GF347_01540 [Candidatus Moranbacteria bacterium]|nr:hypothetical protein [Candidatus Moranbacteria bacterium]
MKKIVYSFLALLMIFGLFGCGKSEKKDTSMPSSSVEVYDQKTKDKPSNETESKIEFSDPGDDEVGQEIQEIDAIINEIDTQDLDETELEYENLEK